MKVWRLDERPELIAGAEKLAASLYPVFIQHDPVSNRYWKRLYSDAFTRFQAVAVDADGRVVALGNSIPFLWAEGEALPDDGWDAVLTAGAEAQQQANALSALSIVVVPDQRGKGIAELLLSAMKAAAHADGLGALVAPVRPTRKADYPMQDFSDYCHWQRPDAAPFDPWIRTHWRAGATIVKVAPRSMTIPAGIAEWQDWTGLTLPKSGRYWFPGGLAPLDVDCERDVAVYVEPNLWMRHKL